MSFALQSMTTPEKKRPWAKAVAEPASEFPPTPLPVISGNLPATLRGSLYRNGPGRLSRGPESVGHWFDGDGAILAVHFQGSQATGTYRFVKTAGYVADEESGRFECSGYGMYPSGSYWRRWSSPLKNAANTSVLALPDQLLALWEAGLPHGLNLETLTTLGLEDLEGLKGSQPYSAHPKRDPHSGDIYNFGVTFGRQPQLCVYRSDFTGRIRQQTAFPLPGTPFIHDFVLGGRYLVFCIAPVRLQIWAVLLRLKSYSDALTWQPQRGTQILVFDRETLTLVRQIDAEPWFQWHFGNGFETEAGEILFNFVRYDDFQTNQYLKEVASGQTQTLAKGRLWELRLDPNSGKILDSRALCDRSCEFPTVAPQDVGQPHRYTYLSMHRAGVEPQHELFGAIARYDAQTQDLQVADLGDGRYAVEPIYAPDAENPEQGWILTVVFDGERAASEVWIYEAKGLDRPPVCRLALPSIIPPGFHGTWMPQP